MRRAGHAGADAESEAALAALCQAYWYPVYVFVRRRGHAQHEAEDLVQGFFLRLLEKNFVAQADAERGKFRTFLLTAVSHHIGQVREHDRRQKRGGGFIIESWDAAPPEERYLREPAHDETPEKAFERQWAEALIERALERVRREYEAAGRGERFEAMKPFLMRHKGESGAALAERLGMGEVAVRTAIHRMRQRFQQVFREEIAETVEDAQNIEEEIRHLIAVMAS